MALPRLAAVRSKCIKPELEFRYQEIAEGPNAHASWWSFYDESVIRARWWHPAEGDLVIDIGAAFGSYTLPALALGARVIAFNPADLDAELLEHNVGLNPEFRTRFLQYRDGIGARDAWFNPNASRFADELPAGARPGGGITAGPNEWIRVRSLDSWATENLNRHSATRDRIAWVKMDIEGAELEALRGAEQLIRSDRPKILVENHQFHHPTMERDVAEFIHGLGLGYAMEGPVPYHSVSHSFFEVR